MKCKKIFFVLITALFMLPVLVSAKEYCTVVSGNGKDIGSEIDCKGEHFYIIDNDDNNVRMIAKYNLDYGSEYDRVVVSEERFHELQDLYYIEKNYYDSTATYREWDKGALLNAEEFEEYRENGYAIYSVNDFYHEFFLTRSIDNSDYETVQVTADRYNELYEIFCGSDTRCKRDYKSLWNEPEFNEGDYVYNWYSWGTTGYFNVDHTNLKQNVKAVGAHGDEAGNPEFPEYGVASWVSLQKIETESYLNGKLIDGVVDSTEFYLTPIERYKVYFYKLGINILKYDYLSVKDIDNIVYNVTGNHLPLQEWWESEWVAASSAMHDLYYIIGSFKNYLPKGYEWLYSTTYWTKTRDVDSSHEYVAEISYYFVDTLGNICNGNICSDAIGAGVRPVVTIARNDILYNIETETDNNGTIDVIRTSPAGEEISFVLKSNEGYKLRSLTLQTESGITVEFDQISETEDGRIIVNTNKFIMPTENVKIIANWETEVIPEPEPEPEPEPTPNVPEEKDTIKEYNIKTIVEGDGSIDVISKSVAGENIEFTIKTLNGSKLISFGIVSEDGKKVEYTKVSEEDGTTTIIVNKFAMPESDITISAKFETVVPVPKTGDNIMRYVTVFVISFIILVALSILGIKNNKQRKIEMN